MLGIEREHLINARRILLDALEALSDHHRALILVGAQAIYLRAGEGDIAVPPYTFDADIALDPSLLSNDPRLGDALTKAGFIPAGSSRIGVWQSKSGSATVDLLVPAAVSGRGRRRAHLEHHGDDIARRSPGLEAALIDNGLLPLTSLEAEDLRRYEVAVAGMTALLIAKLHKLHDREATPHRQDNKDALDVYRLLQALDTTEFVDKLRVLCSDDRSAQISREAITYLEQLFLSATAPGSQMAAQAVEGLEDPARIALSCQLLTEQLLEAAHAISPFSAPDLH